MAEHAATFMPNTPAPARLAYLAVTLTLIALAIHNAASLDDLGDVATSDKALGYGWPLICARGLIETEYFQLSTFPPQFWRNTSALSLVPIGVIVNLFVATILALSMFQTTQWLQARLRAQFTIATMLGLCTFSALLIQVHVFKWNSLAHIIPDFYRLDLTDTFFDYSENIVWASMFACCIWLPNRLGGTLKSKSVKKCT